MQIVSSHVRRAAVVPLINWSSTARRIPRFGLHRISFVRSSEGSSRILVLGNLSNPKPRHTTGGSGRSARRSGRAGSSKIGCQQNYSPRKQKSTVPFKASKKRRFNVPPEARTSEIRFKALGEQNPRLTNGPSAVNQQDDGRSSFLAADQWTVSFFCFCKPFSCKACPGRNIAKNPPYFNNFRICFA